MYWLYVVRTRTVQLCKTVDFEQVFDPANSKHPRGVTHARLTTTHSMEISCARTSGFGVLG